MVFIILRLSFVLFVVLSEDKRGGLMQDCIDLVVICLAYLGISGHVHHVRLGCSGSDMSTPTQEWRDTQLTNASTLGML
jgi:hypothetical protein